MIQYWEEFKEFKKLVIIIGRKNAPKERMANLYNNMKSDTADNGNNTIISRLYFWLITTVMYSLIYGVSQSRQPSYIRNTRVFDGCQTLESNIKEEKTLTKGNLIKTWTPSWASFEFCTSGQSIAKKKIMAFLNLKEKKKKTCIDLFGEWIYDGN